MPDDKVKSTGKPQTGQQTQYVMRSVVRKGVSVLTRPSGHATYETYRQIRKQPTVAMCRMLSISPILAGEWITEADDDAPDDWVRFIQDQIMPLRRTFLPTTLLNLTDYGWSPWEIIYKRDRWEGKTRIMLDRVKSLLVDMTEIMIDPDTGDFVGLRQHPQNSVSYDELEVPYTILINVGREGDNLYGEPILENIRSVWLNWYDANDGAERYDKKMAGSMWVIYYPEGETKVNGTMTLNEDIVAGMIESLESSGSVAVPVSMAAFIGDMNSATPQPAWKIDLIDPSAKQTSFVDRMKYLDTLFVRGQLTTERSMTEGQFGTKAEAGVHSDLALTQREMTHQNVTEEVNTQVVNRLLRFNFGQAAEGKVRIRPAPLIDYKLAFFRDLFKLLLQHPVAGIDAIEAIDLDGLVDAIGAPKSEELVQPVGEGEVDTRMELVAAIQGLYKKVNAPALIAPIGAA